MYRKVLMATDGSATASRAVRLGADLARAVGAEAILLHVGEADRGREVLSGVSSEIGKGLSVSTRTVQGDPADKIIEVAEAEGVDLIVVGNKGMTGASRFLLGSVPNQVSHHAPCHVLIVKTT